MLGLKVSVILAACASMTVAVPTYKSNNSCGYNSFWYGPKNVCLPNGTKNKCNPPTDQSCGNWYWHKDFKYCVPSSPDYGDVGCSDGWKWDDGKYSCVPVPAPTPAPGPGQCKSTHFWWKTTCIPYGGDSAPSYAPNGLQCPQKWYWLPAGAAGRCAPRRPEYGSPEQGSPDCDSKYTWDSDNQYCKSKRY
ncbi:hypothetical protein RSOLAG1IB_06084 [Rhizoctonia solani AG-1 IB]|uniref:Secreted protein n=2 Tax=Rhizoctonia solani TaxID=456999 RepID=M5BR89_THACB|nr:unnamed protein product [Rhizoctonia solani]CCO30273.1 hypothetical protein BN14_04300 [Rhizoctonia solani AG-1 IB]CEL53016.1 hypothetical protein RSOLAG1IB_06084 [Rhizoctonia solani AG-1 IB]